MDGRSEMIKIDRGLYQAICNYMIYGVGDREEIIAGLEEKNARLDKREFYSQIMQNPDEQAKKILLEGWRGMFCEERE